MINRSESFGAPPAIEDEIPPNKRGRSIDDCAVKVLRRVNQPSQEGSPPLKRAPSTPSTPLLRSLSDSQELDPISDDALISKADRLFFSCQYNKAKETIERMSIKPEWFLKRLAIIDVLIEAKHPHKGEGKKLPLEKMANNLRYALQQQSVESEKKFVLEKDSKIFHTLTMGAIQTQQLENGLSGRVAFTQGCRSSMEDTFLSLKLTLKLGEEDHPFEIYGIFDGHGGAEAAVFARDHFAEHFKKALLAHQNENFNDPLLYQALHTSVISLDLATQGIRCGTTATIAIIWNHKIFIANVGDSRTILSDNGIPIQLSQDAKLSEPRIRKKVIKLGGKLFLKNGVMNGLGWTDQDKSILLNVGGSIGDRYILGKSIDGNPPVCCFPATPQNTSYPLHGVRFIVLASDGLWDVCSTHQAIDAIAQCQEETLEMAAKRIIYSALQSGSKDNITLMIIPRVY